MSNTSGPETGEARSLLRPFIKSREEALRIRRINTLFLNSQNTHCNAPPQGFEGPTSQLQKPQRMQGLYGQYLKALQVHSEAQSRYMSLTKAGASNESSHPGMLSSYSTEDSCVESKALFKSYLSLIRNREAHEKAKTLQVYLNALSQKDPSQVSYLDIGEILLKTPKFPQPPSDIVERASQTLPPKSESANGGLLATLEQAVLRASHLKDREERLLGEIDSKPDEDIRRNKYPYRMLQALQKTRDELITWIEEELSKTTLIQRKLDEESNISPLFGPVLESQAEKIKLLYGDYLQARLSLISALSSLARPSPPLESSIDVKLLQSEDGFTDTARLQKIPSVIPGFSNVISRLRALSSHQKSLIQQKTHCTSCLARTQKATSRSLEKLSKESHLLAAYSFLVKPPELQPTLTFLVSKAVHTHTTPSTDCGVAEYDEHIEKARQWAFAAEEASISNKKFVQEKVQMGFSQLSSAQETLLEIKLLLSHYSPDSTSIAEKGGSEKEDIWGIHAGSKIKKKRFLPSKLAGREDDSSKPWRGIDGQLGVLRKGP
ncbi:MAG: hypothetical protein M1829_006309 [Trizodia sp. TS-e1964]|nr:MAG: hypothetical protein M1829_006309 [Trizodia sp. TS-e1964]